jgi:molecular chaperone IbpA
MRTYDLSPLFRSSVGFDRWSNLFDTALRSGNNSVGYPPYNIEKLDDESYRITVAVAGFGEDDIEITAQENLLVVAGKLGDARGDGATYLYRGIAARAFERRFSLADYVEVTGATLVNGVLTIDLAREVPEAMKPRHIAIATAPADKAIESKKAA